MIDSSTLRGVLAGCCLLAAQALWADEPSVLVETQSLHKQTLQTTLTGYGVIGPTARNTVTLSAKRASRVAGIEVALGQRVRRAAVVARLAADPQALAGVKQAQAAVELARGEVARIERLLSEQLATQSQLAAAQKNLHDAQATLDAQFALGGPSPNEALVAPFDGVVVALSAAAGDRVSAGAAILQIARTDALRATIGIEPEDSAQVRTGMPARIYPVLGAGTSIPAEVSDVRALVNPQTQLVDVQLTPKSKLGPAMMPGVRVRAEVQVGTATGYVVPRNAVLRDGKGSYLFQIDGKVAKRVDVSTGLAKDGLQIVSGPLNPALKVVVSGNYELSDGMQVREAAK